MAFRSIRWLVGHQPDALAMVVTVFGDEEHVLTSLEAGAMGYLLRMRRWRRSRCASSGCTGRLAHQSFGLARSVIRRFIAPLPGSGVPAERPRRFRARARESLRLIEGA